MSWLGLDNILAVPEHAAKLVAVALKVVNAVEKLISVLVFASQIGLFDADTSVPQAKAFELILIFGVEA